MPTDKTTLDDVIDRLAAEGLISAELHTEAETYLAHRRAIQPWYIRAMVGFGAWLASLLLIGFVAGLSIYSDGGSAIIGLLLVVIANVVRRASANDFFVQSALASCLAGQALFTWGIFSLIGAEEFEALLMLVIVASVALFFLYPDRIHRVIMVLISGGSLITLFYVWELNALIPVLGPAFAAVLIYVQRTQSQIIASGHGQLLRPLMTGLMLCAFGTLMISTIYVLPELSIDYEFYPRPWVSTILLGMLFLYVGSSLWPRLVDPTDATVAATVYAIMLAIIAASGAAPGLLLALLVIMLGADSGQKSMTAAGVGFLAVFLIAYFYGIETTMLVKSMTLIASGVVVLFARYLVLRFIEPDTAGGTTNA